MENAHTPGPWHRNIKPASRYNTVFAGRNTHVARLVVDSLPAEEIEANCNLIAAAPELLEALKDIVEHSHDLGAVECAQAAIAKATGASL